MDQEEKRRLWRIAARLRYANNIEALRARSNAYGTAHAKERAERAAKWRLANPERTQELTQRSRQKRKERWAEFLESERQRYHKAPDKKLAALKAQRERPEVAAKAKAYQQQYGRDYPEKLRAKVAARRATLLRAMPEWCDRVAIVEIYRRAKALTIETGIKHEVDHIIPLRGRNVSGLHIPINLQILTVTENRQKFTRVAASSDHTSLYSTSVAAGTDERSVAADRRSRASPGGQEYGVDVDGDQAGDY